MQRSFGSAVTEELNSGDTLVSAQAIVLDKVNRALRGELEFDVILHDNLGNSRVQCLLPSDHGDDDTKNGIELYQFDSGIECKLFERSPRVNIELGIENDNPLFQAVSGDEGMQLAIDLIRKSNKILGFTGAGISTESNIPAFRNNKDGTKENTIWSAYDPNELVYSRIVSDERVRTNYLRMHTMLNGLIEKAQPNPSHQLFVELEKTSKLLGVITQNIDGLHQISGVPEEKVCELHGTVHKFKCQSCHAEMDAKPYYTEVMNLVNRGGDFIYAPSCPHCSSGVLKTKTISFGQALDPEVLEEAHELTNACDLMIVMGSALVVAPANQIPLMCVDKNIPVILMNLGETPMDDICTVLLNGRCGEICSQIIPQL